MSLNAKSYYIRFSALLKLALSCIIQHYALQICCNFVAKSSFKCLKSLNLRDYSMIVATRPEPTVLPPSRYRWGVGSGFVVILVVFCAGNSRICRVCFSLREFLLSWCYHAPPPGLKFILLIKALFHNTYLFYLFLQSNKYLPSHTIR